MRCNAVTMTIPLAVLLSLVTGRATRAEAPASQPATEPTTQPAEPGTRPASRPTPRASTETLQKKRVFLFLAPIDAPAQARGDDLAGVLTRLARSKLASLESVNLKAATELPGLPAVLSRFGDLERLDRVSLIAIKNTTGFDGLIRIRYRYERDGRVRLTVLQVDFRNGQVFRKRDLVRTVDAELFRTVQDDLVQFATRIRRSYRVTVKIDSNPPGSEISINGKPAGRTPLLKELKGGDYTIRVSKKGYRAYERSYTLSDGDTLVLNATLYNPLAARFLNAAPGLRIDSRQLNLGYRYVYVGAGDLGAEHAHFFSAEGLLRIRSFDVGLRFGVSGLSSSEPLDTFVGTGEGARSQDHLLLQVHALVKYVLWEKFSFASLRLCLGQGMTHARTTFSDRALSAWSYSADAYFELVTRIGRGGNFSLEVQADLGLSYLGRIPSSQQEFSLFGAGPEQEVTRHVVGPFAGLSLRLNFFNDIF